MAQDDTRTRLSGLIQRPDLPDEVRKEITDVIGTLSKPLESDVWIYRIVVVVLGLVVLCTVVGGIYITELSRGDRQLSLPEGIVAIGSAAVGALAGLLAPSPGGGPGRRNS